MQGQITRRFEGLENQNNPYEQIVNYTMFYDAGDECTDVTGGWIGGRYITDYGSAVGTMTKNADSLRCQAGTSGSLVSAGFYTVNKMDLSAFDAVYYNICELYDGYACHIAINTVGREHTANNVVGYSANDVFALGLSSLDISNVTSSAYVGFGCWAYGSIIAVNAIFVVKQDDWQTLAEKAGVTTDSIEALLEHSSIILSSKNLVNYMIAQCTGDFMASAIQSSTFLTALESSPYKEKVYANEHWAKFLAMVA